MTFLSESDNVYLSKMMSGDDIYNYEQVAKFLLSEILRCKTDILELM